MDDKMNQRGGGVGLEFTHKDRAQGTERRSEEVWKKAVEDYAQSKTLRIRRKVATELGEWCARNHGASTAKYLRSQVGGDVTF